MFSSCFLRWPARTLSYNEFQQFSKAKRSIFILLRGLSQKKLTTVSVIVTLRGGGVEAVTL